MAKVKFWSSIGAAMLTLGVLRTVPVLSQAGGSTGLIAGTVKTAAGAALEGVIVSARNANETWTTDVYTDRQGRFDFPALTAGQYSMWAQAKGFAAAQASFTLAGGSRAQQSLTLQPLADPRKIEAQLDGPEWFAALPETNNQDRRMKHLLRNNCTACHGPAYTLAPRFDANGWKIIIDVMARGVPPTKPTGAGDPVYQAYKDELAEYLARVSPGLQPKPDPVQTTGAATRAVITEFDIPRQGRPISAHAGTIWTEGQSTRYESKGARDIWIDSKGSLWVSDDRSMGRTTGKLDPRTGAWTDYAMLNDKGVAGSSHGIWGARNIGGTDWVYQGGQADGAILAFDTKAEQFVHFAKPEGMPGGGGHIDVDSKGNAWAPAGNGVLKLDVRTGEYTYYPIPYPPGTPKANQNSYGLAVDANDQVWVARAGIEGVGWVDPKTGQSGNTLFEAQRFPGLTDKDLNMAVGMNFGPPHGKGPRRLGSGGKNGGNFMWVALNKSDALAKIDIRTRLVVKEYPLPQGSAPYFATVDKNGMVWVPPQNADRIFKFNPKTEQFMTFMLPTRGTDLRHLTVDDTTTPPTIWVTYNRSNKIARLQER